MILQGLIPALSRASTFDAALSQATRSSDFSLVDGLRIPLLAGLLDRRRAHDDGTAQALLVITATGRESEAVRGSFASYLPDAEVIEFPAWETLPHERLSPSAETVGKRIHALRRLAAWSTARASDPASVAPIVVVAGVRAALQPISDNLADIDPVVLRTGGRGYDLASISTQLVDLAYARVDMVTRRGEFAVRGGILDVFPPLSEHPVRVDFFGDEVDQIRLFSVADQRSLDTEIDSVELPPSREMLLTEAVRQRAREMQHEFPSLAQMLEKIGQGIPVEGMESLAPALVQRLVPLTHYLPASCAIAVLSPERVVSRAQSLAETNREFLEAAWSAATAGAEAPIDLDSGDFLTPRDLREHAGGRTWWSLSGFDSGVVLSDEEKIEAAGDYVRVEAETVPSFSGNAEGAVEHVADRIADGWSVVVTARGPGLVERARDVLAERGIAAR
ncbi:MAG: transcription-repair coupling factor, partial [Frondihabitans sp.]|nr:transcription-repair coupling factor [Frondihabitans sp.]